VISRLATRTGPLLDLYRTVIMKNNLMLAEQVGSEVTELDFPLQ
jgi:hypothetical protein